MARKSAKPTNQNKEFFEAIQLLEQERGIPADYLLEKVCAAIITSVRREYGGEDVVFVECNAEKSELRVYLRKTVVEEIENDFTEILPEDAKKYNKNALVGDIVEIPLETKQFGRIAATTAKNVIRGDIHDAERGLMLREFESKQKELVTGKVQSVDPQTGNATLEIGKAVVVLPKSRQLPDEVLKEGQLVKVYIEGVKDTPKGPKAMISRTHSGLVKRLFETEVPEIYDGIVEIKSISREAGSRTKMAVWSKDENVDAIGACIGPKRSRITAVVNELNGEKIDIIPWSENPREFIAKALAPAEVVKTVITSVEEKTCTVVVPNNQLSLAIGNKGQNAKLAAKLTGYKIDIKPQTNALTGEPAEELAEDYPDALLNKADEVVDEVVEEITEIVEEAAVESVEAVEETAAEAEAVEE